MQLNKSNEHIKYSIDLGSHPGFAEISISRTEGKKDRLMEVYIHTSGGKIKLNTEFISSVVDELEFLSEFCTEVYNHCKGYKENE